MKEKIKQIHFYMAVAKLTNDTKKLSNLELELTLLTGIL